MGRVAGVTGLLGLTAAVAAIAWMHRALGGDLRVFVQPEAFAVVGGGTIAALLVSFPSRTRARVFAGLADLMRRPAAPAESLVPIFIALAFTARRQGWAAVEAEITRMKDPFLARALTLSISGLSPDIVKETMEVEARVTAQREEEQAQVFDAAARYAPTLGILGGLLGFMRVVEQGAWSAVASRGVASALVSVVYGVALASLIFLPIAARLRARARTNTLRRELTIQGVIALRDGAAPSVVQERLAGYVQRGRTSLADVA